MRKKYFIYSIVVYAVLIICVITPVKVSADPEGARVLIEVYLDPNCEDPVVIDFIEKKGNNYFIKACQKVWTFYQAYDLNLEFRLNTKVISKAHKMNGAYTSAPQNNIPITVFLLQDKT